MKSRRLPTWVQLAAVIGAGGATVAFLILNRRARIAHADVLIAIAMGVFFLSSLAAFLGLLRWRDQRRAAAAALAHPPLSIHTRVAPRPAPDRPPSVYDLEPGVEYAILQPFVDYHGQPFEAGQRLRFVGRSFLPYHGGHTLFFEGRAIYFQEQLNADIVGRFAEFFGYAR